jgi:hypothetical protein
MHVEDAFALALTMCLMLEETPVNIVYSSSSAGPDAYARLFATALPDSLPLQCNCNRTSFNAFPWQ